MCWSELDLSRNCAAPLTAYYAQKENRDGITTYSSIQTGSGALTSGLSRKQVASDFDVGFSTLNRWIQLERKELPAPTAQSDLEAEVMAVALRKPPKGCIHHSDRGSQYCSHDYQKRLRQHGFKASMSGKGNCYDNAVVEAFFKTIKAELIWRHPWHTRRAAELAIFPSHGLQANHCRAAEYINGFYNPRRKHSALGWKSPLAFERIAA